VALYAAPPESWYYDEQKSGGMILTHMTYAFINPLRWLLGNPLIVSAFANRKFQTQPGKVRYEMCSANFIFPNNVICNMIAGYVKPKQFDAWKVTLIGTDGCLEVHPGDLDAGSLIVYSNEQTVLTHRFSENNAFVRQAMAFANAIEQKEMCLNPAADAALDVMLSELIAQSIEERSTLDIVPK
jgi:predicted dehydrogenase